MFYVTKHVCISNLTRKFRTRCLKGKFTNKYNIVNIDFPPISQIDDTMCWLNKLLIAIWDDFSIFCMHV